MVRRTCFAPLSALNARPCLFRLETRTDLRHPPLGRSGVQAATARGAPWPVRLQDSCGRVLQRPPLFLSVVAEKFCPVYVEATPLRMV